MSDRLHVALLVCVLALAAGGCGGSTHHSSSTSAASASTTSAAVPSSTTSTTSTSTTSTTSTNTTKTSGTLQALPPPTPAGTPAAPDGLRQTTGYGTYELCRAHCSGAVPAALRRSLHLPSGCSASSAAGPVKPQGSSTLSVGPFIGSSWMGAQVTWAASGYSGPILIRGRQVGGPHAVGFGEGHVPYDELQLYDSGGGRQWQTFTRVRARGCYGYQVDGTSFSQIIVFKAM